MLSYGLSGYTSELRLPIVIDLEPWIPLNKLSPRDSAKILVHRLQKAHPHLKPHIVMDSAFGSFTDVGHYHSKGVLVTFSMAAKKKSWLWDLLLWQVPVDAGRVALLSLPNPSAHLLASGYRVMSESRKLIDIRTVSTAFKFKPAESADLVVVKIGGRRRHDSGFFEYETHWEDGDVTWQQARSFMDLDGTFVILWLEKAEEVDIMEALSDLTVDKLQEICKLRSWKVA
jgi:hypothetical protein